MKQQFPPVCCSSLAVALVKRCSWACQTCSIYWKQIVDHKWPKRASAIKCVHSTHGNTMKVAFFFTKPYLVWTWLQHLWPTQPSQVGKGTESGLDQPNIPFLILSSKIDQRLCCMGLFVSYSNSIVSLLDYCQARTRRLPDCVAKISESFGWSLQWRPGQPASSLLDDHDDNDVDKEYEDDGKAGTTIPLCTFRRNLKY